MTPGKNDILQTDIETIISIGEKIIQYHTLLGVKSPLNNVVIADFNAKISIAKHKHEEGVKYKKLMEEAWRERDYYYLGIQDKSIKNTLMTISTILRKDNWNTAEWGL